MADKKKKDVQYAECPICSLVFPKKQARQRYCSPKCSGKAKKTRDSVYIKGYVENVLKTECRYCGKIFKRRASAQLYCSPQCKKANAADKPKSEGKAHSIDDTIAQMKKEGFKGSYGQYVALKYMSKKQTGGSL